MPTIVLARFPDAVRAVSEKLAFATAERLGQLPTTRLIWLPNGDPDVPVTAPLNLCLYDVDPLGQYRGLLTEAGLVERLTLHSPVFVHPSEVYDVNRERRPLIRISGKRAIVRDYWQHWQAHFVNFDCELRQIDRPRLNIPTGPHVLVYDTLTKPGMNLAAALEADFYFSDCQQLKNVPARFVQLFKFIPAVSPR